MSTKLTKFMGVKFHTIPLSSVDVYHDIKIKLDHDGKALIRQFGPVGDQLVIEAIYPTNDLDRAESINKDQSSLSLTQRSYYGDLSLHKVNPSFDSRAFRESMADYFDDDFLLEWHAHQQKLFNQRHL